MTQADNRDVRTRLLEDHMDLIHEMVQKTKDTDYHRKWLLALDMVKNER
jgi:hypothetical protein